MLKAVSFEFFLLQQYLCKHDVCVEVVTLNCGTV